MEHFEAAIGMMLDRLSALEGAQHSKADLAEAVGVGIAAAVANPAVWCGAAEGMRKAAEQQAGSWLMGWLLRWLLRGMLLMGGGIVVYQLGGWSALAAMWNNLGGHS